MPLPVQYMRLSRNLKQACIAIQNNVPRVSIPTAMAILILCQNLGCAIFLTVAQSIFSNNLRRHIVKDAMGVDASAVIAGSTRMVRKLVTPKQVPAVLSAYSKAIDVVMYLGLVIGVFAFVCAWNLGFKDIVKKG